MKVLGLCEGRHQIEQVEEYIFPADFFAEPGSMFDYSRINQQISAVLGFEDTVVLYVTGLTPVIVEVILYCHTYCVNLELMHYNRETDSYVSQPIFIGDWV